MTLPPFDTLSRNLSRLALAACTAIAGGIPNPAIGQRSQLPGPYVEREIPALPLGFFPVPREGPRKEVGLLTRQPDGFALLRLAAGDSLAIVRQVRLSGTPRAAAFLDGNPARSARFAILSGEGDTVQIAKVTRHNVEMRDIPLPGKADNILCTDIDGDRHREIVAFGKKIAGLIPLSSGSPAEVRDPLFPEISASDAAVLDVDRDGVNDVLLLDWLNDRVVYRQGIGKGSFSEPSEVSLPGEPQRFATLSRGENLWIAVTIPSGKQIAVIARDTTDRLLLEGTCTLPWEPEGVALRDVNGDGRPDVLSSGGGEVAVLLGIGGGRFESPVHYQATRGVWMVEDLDGDRLPDLLVADPQRRTLGAALHSISPVARRATSYLVGKHLSGLLITEASGDRRRDIVVSSAGALTGYTQIGGGLFDPIRAVETPPDARRAVAGPHPGRFLLSFRTTEDLAVVSLQGEQPPTSFPAGIEPFVLISGIDPARGTAWILSRYRTGARKEFSLSLHEQLNDRQYLEGGVGGGIPQHITAVAACPPSAGVPATLVVVTHDLARREYAVVRYPLGPRGEPTGGEQLALLDDAIGRFAWLVARDLDGDGHVDLLLGLQRPTQKMAVLYGGEQSRSAADLQYLQGLACADERWLQVCDADGDGWSDLVVCSDEQRAIDVAYGTGSRSFGPPRPVVRPGEITAFAVGSLFGGCDLVIGSTHGTMTVYPSAFLRDR